MSKIHEAKLPSLADTIAEKAEKQNEERKKKVRKTKKEVRGSGRASTTKKSKGKKKK